MKKLIQSLKELHNLKYEKDLNHSRQNMIKALELFFQHIKYSLTTLTAIFATSFTIAAFAIEKQMVNDQLNFIVLIGSSIFLILMGPVSFLSYRLVARYYKLYVSCYVYAARLHDKYSSSKHPWFEEMKERIEDLENPMAVNQFINDEVSTKNGRNSWFFYKLFILMLGVIGSIIGIVILGILVWFYLGSPWIDFLQIKRA
ncbi:MAG: hypothetical protein WAU15_05515 [Nitrosomonas sp.]